MFEDLNLDKSFGRNLRAVREASGLSQAEVAQKMQPFGYRFHQTTVNKIEAGDRKTAVGEGWALAKVLGVDLETLLEDHSEPVKDAEFVARTLAVKWARELKDLRGPLLSAVDAQDKFLGAVDELRMAVQRESLDDDERRRLADVLYRWSAAGRLPGADNLVDEISLVLGTGDREGILFEREPSPADWDYPDLEDDEQDGPMDSRKSF